MFFNTCITPGPQIWHTKTQILVHTTGLELDAVPGQCCVPQLVLTSIGRDRLQIAAGRWVCWCVGYLMIFEWRCWKRSKGKRTHLSSACKVRWHVAKRYQLLCLTRIIIWLSFVNRKFCRKNALPNLIRQVAQWTWKTAAFGEVKFGQAGRLWRLYNVWNMSEHDLAEIAYGTRCILCLTCDFASISRTLRNWNACSQKQWQVTSDRQTAIYFNRCHDVLRAEFIIRVSHGEL